MGVNEPQQTFNVNFIDKIEELNKTRKLYKIAEVKAKYINPFENGLTQTNLFRGLIPINLNQSVFITNLKFNNLSILEDANKYSLNILA